ALYLLTKSRTVPLPGDAELSALSIEGWRLVPLSLTRILLQKPDRLLLPLLAGAAELGRYAFVSSLMELVAWPVAQWVDTQIGRWRSESRSTSPPGVARAFCVVLGTSLFLVVAVGT